MHTRRERQAVEHTLIVPSNRSRLRRDAHTRETHKRVASVKRRGGPWCLIELELYWDIASDRLLFDWFRMPFAVLYRGGIVILDGFEAPAWPEMVLLAHLVVATSFAGW